MEQCEIISNGLKLDASIIYPVNLNNLNPAILFVHGWTSHKERSFQYAETLSSLGFICLLFDLRGHGKSEEDIHTSTNNDFLHDVMSSYDFLLDNNKVDKNNISVIGSSFGGYLISLLTAKRTVHNLILRAPADYPNDSLNKPKQSTSGNDPFINTWRNKPKSSKETYALEAIHSFDGNVLLIESELDERIPHQTIMNYYNAMKDKTKIQHVLLKGAPHSIKEGTFRDKVETLLKDWFRNNI